MMLVNTDREHSLGEYFPYSILQTYSMQFIMVAQMYYHTNI